jgi:hypothetical protein
MRGLVVFGFHLMGETVFWLKSLYQLEFVCVFLVFIFGLGNYFSNAGVLNMVSLSAGQLCIFLHVSLLFLVRLKE